MITTFAIACLAAVAYAYVGFPLLAILRAWLFPRPWRQAEITPSVSLVIICHNEEASIGGKLANVLSLDYPADQLQILIGSDGSTDATEAIVSACGDPRVRLLAYPRRGKIPALNDTVAEATGEVLVFSDANSQFDRDALRCLTRHFADDSIGCVAGNQVYTNDPQAGTAAAGERSYWSYDRRLKLAESTAGNAISATGAIYAIRRDLFCPAPSGVTDDFAISTRVIRQGYRLVFDPQAIATEPVAGKPKAEFRRKTRVMTRGFRSVFSIADLLNPFRYGFYAIQLFSHKVLRRLVAIPLLLLLALTPFIEWDWFRIGLILAQAAVYVPAILGYLLSGTSIGRSKVVSVPYYFCLVNLAALVALGNVIAGRKIERWDTQRPADSTTQTAIMEQQAT